jgi:hypothetical protein
MIPLIFFLNLFEVFIDWKRQFTPAAQKFKKYESFI